MRQVRFATACFCPVLCSLFCTCAFRRLHTDKVYGERILECVVADWPALYGGLLYRPPRELYRYLPFAERSPSERSSGQRWRRHMFAWHALCKALGESFVATLSSSRIYVSINNKKFWTYRILHQRLETGLSCSGRLQATSSCTALLSTANVQKALIEAALFFHPAVNELDNNHFRLAA